tara:strand:- start:1244 stop:2041 length:798 start_codon:yes stop_codon:yes gene_type:complete
MSFETKVMQIKNSIRYSTIQPYKFYILKDKYRKEREKTINRLSLDRSVLSITNESLYKGFDEYVNDYKDVEKRILSNIEEVTKNTDIKIHGIQYPDFLYFIIRKIKPGRVLETGVWLGLSTNFILSAGTNYSSNFQLDSIDLPRFEIQDSKQYQGILVEKKFKENWNLYVGKDRKHLKNLICKYKYDLFYFDSDKSLNGKMFLFETTKKHNNDYFMIFDDIEDNNFWYRKELSNENKILIEYNNKYFGIIYSDKYSPYVGKLYEK